jgi:hypothetical protein
MKIDRLHIFCAGDFLVEEVFVENGIDIKQLLQIGAVYCAGIVECKIGGGEGSASGETGDHHPVLAAVGVFYTQ